MESFRPSYDQLNQRAENRIRPDTSTHIFQPLMGQDWIKQYEDRDVEPKSMTSAQSTEQIRVHLRDLRPYSMPDISDIQTWGQLRPRESLTINQWQGNQMSTPSNINIGLIESKAPNPNYKIPKSPEKASSLVR